MIILLVAQGQESQIPQQRDNNNHLSKFRISLSLQIDKNHLKTLSHNSISNITISQAMWMICQRTLAQGWLMISQKNMEKPVDLFSVRTVAAGLQLIGFKSIQKCAEKYLLRNVRRLTWQNNVRQPMQLVRDSKRIPMLKRCKKNKLLKLSLHKVKYPSGNFNPYN